MVSARTFQIYMLCIVQPAEQTCCNVLNTVSVIPTGANKGFQVTMHCVDIWTMI